MPPRVNRSHDFLNPTVALENHYISSILCAAVVLVKVLHQDVGCSKIVPGFFTLSVTRLAPAARDSSEVARALLFSHEKR